MRALTVIILLTPLLGACAVTPPPAIEAAVSGPVFAATVFDCGGQPVPPDKATARGPHGSSATANYKDDLKYQGQHCANPLHAVCGQLAAAGQVVDAAGHKAAMCQANAAGSAR